MIKPKDITKESIELKQNASLFNFQNPNLSETLVIDSSNTLSQCCFLCYDIFNGRLETLTFFLPLLSSLVGSFLIWDGESASILSMYIISNACIAG